MKRKVVVNDRMQHGYVYYRTEPVGRRFAPEFHPQLTPKQMLECRRRQCQAVLHWAYDSRKIQPDRLTGLAAGN